MTTLSATMRVLEPAPGALPITTGESRANACIRPSATGWTMAPTRSVLRATPLSAGARRSSTTPTSARSRALHPQHLTSLGVSDIEVVLSHWHTDHIAGNAVFADCMIIANPQTALAMVENERLLSQKTRPSIRSCCRTGCSIRRLSIAYGTRRIELLQFDIHSADGTVVWLPAKACFWRATRWRIR